MAKRIDVSHLNVYYSNFLAVEDVTLAVEPKAVTAFIGPSGCGKSTVLRTLNRMHEVTPGARIEGKIMLDHEDKDRLDRPGSVLSGGQQQRLCIARAIAIQPQVLLMDEPCSALDPISTLAIEELIHELKQSYTIVIVTHNMQQAARVSDTTAFFNIAGTGKPGKLIEMNTTANIFSSPTEKATEDYISGRFG